MKIYQRLSVIRIPKNLRSQFYKDFKENTFSYYHIKLKDFERCLGKKIGEFFDPISAIMEHQEKHIRVYQRGSERENKSTHRTFGALGSSDSQTNNMVWWHMTYGVTGGWPFELLKESRLCFNYLSNSHMIKECESRVCCRVNSCSKRRNTLLNPPSDNSSNGLRSYQNYHHATDSRSIRDTKWNWSNRTYANCKESHLFASHTDN